MQVHATQNLLPKLMTINLNIQCMGANTNPKINYGPFLVIELLLKNTIVGVEVLRFTLKSRYEWYLLHIRYT